MRGGADNEADEEALLAALFAESLTATESERQEAIGDIRRLPTARPLHYHLSHDVMPAYFAEPAHLGVLQQLMADQEGAAKLLQQLYEQTLRDFPGCDRCFGAAEIICARHHIKSSWPESPDIPLLVLTMPQPMADKETFLVCLGLLPAQEFYHNTQWRYFVVDGAVRAGQTAESFLWEYVRHDNLPAQAGFLLVGSCWPTVDGLLAQLTQQWDERFYTL